MVPDEGDAPPPVFGPSAVEVLPPGERQPRPTWTVETDVATGRASATIRTGTAFTSIADTLVERDFEAVCEVDPVDPAAAVARGWHRCRSTREDGWTEARAEVEIRSDAATFTVAIDLEVRVDGAVHATRRWDETIPRALL